MKKILSVLLALCLLCSLAVPVLAADDSSDSSVCVVIGSDLTEDEKNAVYAQFGVERGTVKELTLTNAEEHSGLAGYVSDDVIGTRSLSCVCLKMLPEGSGVQMSLNNISWCTADMYSAALYAAGIDNVQCIITAPCEVSGTAALVGIYKAYEDMTGEEISDVVKQLSTGMLVDTASLTEELGSYDTSVLVEGLKEVLADTRNMSDDELKSEIRSLTQQYNVSVSDSQIDTLVNLCRQMEQLDDADLLQRVDQLKQTVQTVQNAAQTVSETVNTVANTVSAVKDFFLRVGSFFKGLFS